MTDNVQSAMLEILKRIQGDVADVKCRLERLETAARKQSRDNAALLVMMRGTVGIFDKRLGNREHGVCLLQERE